MSNVHTLKKGRGSYSSRGRGRGGRSRGGGRAGGSSSAAPAAPAGPVPFRGVVNRLTTARAAENPAGIRRYCASADATAQDAAHAVSYTRYVQSLQEDLQDAAACNAALDAYEAHQAPRSQQASPSKRKRSPELSGDSKGGGERKDTIVLCDSSEEEEGGDAGVGGAAAQQLGAPFPAAASACGAGAATVGTSNVDGRTRAAGTAPAKQRQQEDHKAAATKRKKPPGISNGSKCEDTCDDVIILCDSSDSEDGENAPVGAARQRGQPLPASSSAAAASRAGVGAMQGGRAAGTSRAAGASSAATTQRQQQQVPRRNFSSGAGGFTGGSNPFMDPPRYIPPGGESALDLNLSVRETARVADAGMGWRAASALLDTGNSGHTMVTRRLAESLGLLGGLSNVRQVTVRGVVAGAEERVPVVPLTYEIKGKRLMIMAAVTDATLGCDLLVSVHDIRIFEESGMRLSTR